MIHDNFKTYLWAVCYVCVLCRLPIEGRNAMEVVFRLFELGVALWFSCCLWNWKRWVAFYQLHVHVCFRELAKMPAVLC